MSKPEHHLESARWLRYAAEDLKAAEAMLGQLAGEPRHVCFLSQPRGNSIWVGGEVRPSGEMGDFTWVGEARQHPTREGMLAGRETGFLGWCAGGMGHGQRKPGFWVGEGATVV